jgi:predicted lipoprotein with Yx(FWY)xxD motif
MFGKSTGISALASMIALAACNNAGGSSPTPVSSGNVPIQETVAGQPGFVNPANHLTLYFLSSDPPTGAACTGGCLSAWPPMTPSSGARPQNSFTIITRSDGTGKQWAYESHPLYMFSGDSGPDQANGEGITFPGGTWHVVRPTI